MHVANSCYTTHCIVTKNKILYFISFFSAEFIPCCPDISPFSTVVTTGTSTNFACHVKMKKGGIYPKKAIEKYLSFRWYKEEDSEITYNETNRHNQSSSVLMIKNAKFTPEGGVNYHCKMSYRGRTWASEDARLVVHGKLSIFVRCNNNIIACCFLWETVYNK